VRSLGLCIIRPGLLVLLLLFRYGALNLGQRLVSRRRQLEAPEPALNEDDPQGDGGWKVFGARPDLDEFPGRCDILAFQGMPTLEKLKECVGACVRGNNVRDSQTKKGRALLTSLPSSRSLPVALPLSLPHSNAAALCVCLAFVNAPLTRAPRRLPSADALPDQHPTPDRVSRLCVVFVPPNATPKL
jgi:hypothetical protein